MRKLAIIISMSLLLVLSACGGNETKTDSIDVINFADAGWDSIRVHNSIAHTIIEEGYGYDTDVTNWFYSCNISSS